MTRRPTPAEHPAAQALRRCRHPTCASPMCPRPTGRPTAASDRGPCGSGRAASRPSHRRSPGQPGRHRLGIHGVEVASGGQRVDQAPQRRTRRSRGDEPAVEGPQDLVDLARGAGQPGHHLGGGEPQYRGDVPVVAQALGDGRVPAGPLQIGNQCAGRSSASSTAARSSLPSSARPSACRRPGTVWLPPNSCRARRIASTRSSRSHRTGPGRARAGRRGSGRP